MSGASLFRALVEHITSRLRFLGVYEYRLGAIDDELARCDLQPVSPSIGLPILRRVLIRPGIPGARGRPVLGSHVLVAFIDGDQARPVVVAFHGPEEASGHVPDELHLDATEMVRVGESADAVHLAGGTELPVSSAGRAAHLGMMVVGPSALGVPFMLQAAPSEPVSKVRVT